MRKTKVFFQQSYYSFKALYGWINPFAYVFMNVLNPILQLCFFCMLDKYIYHVTDVTPYVIGNAIIMCTVNCIFGIGSTMPDERYYGTLKLLIVSPSNNIFTFLQKAVFHIAESILTVGMALLVGSLIFGANLTSVDLGQLCVVILIAILSTSCLGLFVASIGVATDSLNLIMNLFSMMFLAFTGVNYPLERLPMIFRGVGKMLPMTRSIQLAKLLLQRESIYEHYGMIIGEICVGIAYLVIGYVFLTFAERIAQKKGNFDLY